MFDTLILSGGALKGIQMLGSLYFCEKYNLLNNIQNYIGVSVGSIICYFSIIGYSSDELFIELVNSPIWNLLNISNINIYLIFEKNFIFDIKILKEELERLTLKKLKYFPTFEMLNKNLSVLSFNYTQNKLIYFSKEETPKYDVIDSIILSSSLPFIFSESIRNINEKANLFIDGGIISNFPIQYAIKYNNSLNKNKILGIYFEENTKKGKNNIIDLFFNKIIFSSQKYNFKKELENSKKYPFIKLINLTSDLMIFNFSIKNEQKKELFFDGYNQTKELFFSLNS